MKRNLLVIVVVLAALAVMIWAGVANINKHHREEAHLRQLQQKIEASQPANGNVANQIANAADSGMDDMPENPLQGQMAPNFTLPNTHGKKVSLADYKGKAVVLDFWATWCAPCKIEIPWLEQFQTKYASHGLQIIGISEDELDMNDPKALAKEKRDIAEKAKDLKINYPVLYDDANVSTPYGGVDGLPTTFFINRKGKVVASTVGLAPRDEIEANILKALGNGTKGAQS